VLNRVIIIGRLASDPELRTTATGKNVTSFRIAVQKKIKPADGSPDADFFSVTAWGQTARAGDFQLQYQYFYKPANGFVSQFTDDDVGTGSGVNVKTNQLRVNFGITRFLAWENRLYIQKGISVNNPAINYFLPLQQGYNTQFRLHSQFVFTF